VSVFDFHARLAPGPGAAPRLLASMDANGITRAVVCAGGMVTLDTLAEHVMVGGYVTHDADNEGVRAACGGSGGRLVPFFFGNPHTPPAEYRATGGGYRGLELSPAVHGVALTDPRTLAWVEIAAEADHPVYVVCLAREGVNAGDLVTLAKSFPGTTFVLGHCGFVGVDLWSLGRVGAVPNIAAETSGCYTRVAALAVERLGADRVLFGTEQPLQAPSVELAKMRVLGLDEQSREQVMWTNAVRLTEGAHR
jgi:hypothetical protein